MPGARFKGIRLRTSGSGSSSGTFIALRKAGATAREMLVTAAAQKWGVEPQACRAELGSVLHNSTGRKIGYGDLAELAAKQPVPQTPALKDPKDFRLIGKPIRRIDAHRIVTGKAVYGLDARPPAALVAVVKRCPHLDGKLGSFDPKKALAVPGVRQVTPIRSGIFPGIAVVADNTWAAMKGRDALTVEWERGPSSSFESGAFIESLDAAGAREGYPIRRDGDTSSVFDAAAARLDATYEYPFEAHAPVEPMNCIADVRADSCEVWAPSQTPETAHENIMKALGLPSEAVKVHTTLLGGAFGRRLFVDYVDEAVELSKAIGKPVQIVWTRDDDMRNGFFHPASIEKMSAALGDGRILAWRHKSVGSDLSMFGLPTEEEKRDPQHYAKDELPWGAFDTPYKFASLKIDYVPVDSPVPTGAWRAVMYPSRVFARESFMDEVAHTLGKDSLQLRIDLLQPGDIIALGDQKVDRGRMIRVLEMTREASRWATPFTLDGRLAGRGLAINAYHAGSYMAQVAEVSVARDLSDLRVHRIVCVFDCGLAINPAGLEGQVESGITWGLSAALHGKIDFKNGCVQQSGYHDFRVLRMNEMPAIEIHIVHSNARPGGFGEHPVPHVAPAVANAIFAATGKRVRKLPIRL
jgi:isoquinoline 1-oxidoreductase beta subunit